MQPSAPSTIQADTGSTPAALRRKSKGKLSAQVSTRTMIVTVGTAVLCGLCCLGFLPWGMVIPGLLAAAGIGFVIRGLVGGSRPLPGLLELVPWRLGPLPVDVPQVTTAPSESEVTAVATSEDFQLPGIAWVAMVIVVGAVVMFIRKTDSFLNPQFWAEDPYLFQQARSDGWTSLLKTHSKGQTFLLQRAVAYLERPAPPRYAPHFYSFTALAIALLSSAYIARARISGVGPLAKALMALVPMFIYGTGEVYMTLANLHWLLAPLLVTLAMERDPGTPLGRVLLYVAVGVLCLTGPFSMFLWPLFLVRLIVRRNWCSIGLLAVVLPCVAWQYFRADLTRSTGRFHLMHPHWPTYFGRNYVGELFLGQLAEKIEVDPMWFVALFAAVYLALAIYAICRRDMNVTTLLLASLLCLGSGAVLFRHMPQLIDFAGHRYYFLPFVCLAWAFLIVAARSPGVLRVGAGAIVVLMAAASLTHFTFKPQLDLHWAECSKFIDGPDPCFIYINPYKHFFITYQPDPFPDKPKYRDLPDPLPPAPPVR